MSSVEDVTSDSIIAEGTSGKDSELFVLTAEDEELIRTRTPSSALAAHYERIRLCNCNAYGQRPKGHSIKCRSYRPSGWRKGPTDNYTEGTKSKFWHKRRLAAINRRNSPHFGDWTLWVDRT